MHTIYYVISWTRDFFYIIELSSLAILNTYYQKEFLPVKWYAIFSMGESISIGYKPVPTQQEIWGLPCILIHAGCCLPDEAGVTLFLCIHLCERKHFCLASTLPPHILGPWTFEPGQWGSAPGDFLIHQCVRTVSYVHMPQKRHCLTIRLGAQPQLRPTLTKQFLPCIK